MKKYYDILGISINASKDEIKTAYRKKALVAHPDCGGSNESFKIIAEAYGIIKTGKLPQADITVPKASPPPKTPSNPTVKAVPHGVVFHQTFHLQISRQEDSQYTKKIVHINVKIPCSACGANPIIDFEPCLPCTGRGHSTSDNPFRSNDSRGRDYDELYWGTCKSCKGTGKNKIILTCDVCKGDNYKEIKDKFMITIPPSTSVINIPNYWSEGNDLVININVI